jgi:hypothetical protein
MWVMTRGDEALIFRRIKGKVRASLRLVITHIFSPLGSEFLLSLENLNKMTKKEFFVQNVLREFTPGLKILGIQPTKIYASQYFNEQWFAT